MAVTRNSAIVIPTKVGIHTDPRFRGDDIIMNPKSIDVVILCGGLGRRLRGVLGDSQKVMAKVGQKPFLDVILLFLKKQGFRRIILCTGFQGDLVQKYYTQNPLGLEILFSPETKPLGTGGAIKNAMKKIESRIFLAMNGDSFCPLDFKKFLRFHLKQNALATIAVYKLKKNVDSGSITMDDSKRIIRFDEKMPAAYEQFVNAGIYGFDQSVFKYMPKSSVFSLEYDFFPALIGNSFYGFLTQEEFLDIGTPERYDKAQKIFQPKG